MEEKDIRALGLTKDADVRRAMSLVTRLKQEHRQMSLEMDALYIDDAAVKPEMGDQKRFSMTDLFRGE